MAHLPSKNTQRRDSTQSLEPTEDQGRLSRIYKLTGFQGKTLWDWMQLLIVSAALAGVGLLFNDYSTKTQLKIAEDSQQETTLQTYIDNISELLLDRHLRTAQHDAEIRDVARTRTL